MSACRATNSMTRDCSESIDDSKTLLLLTLSTGRNKGNVESLLLDTCSSCKLRWSREIFWQSDGISGVEMVPSLDLERYYREGKEEAHARLLGLHQTPTLTHTGTVSTPLEQNQKKTYPIKKQNWKLLYLRTATLRDKLTLLGPLWTINGLYPLGLTSFVVLNCTNTYR